MYSVDIFIMAYMKSTNTITCHVSIHKRVFTIMCYFFYTFPFD